MEFVFVILIFILGLICCIHGEIYVYKNDALIFTDVLEDMLCKYGPGIPSSYSMREIEEAYPADGCTNMTKFNSNSDVCVIIKRYGCTFERKVRNAQAANYAAVIIHNVDSNALEPMSYENSTGILIPALFVSEQSGMILRESSKISGAFIIIEEKLEINPEFMIVFILFVTVTLFSLLGSIFIRWIRNRMRRRRYLLPTSVLKSIPKQKYDKNMIYETCVICQENFKQGDVIRILPCSHAYHAKCIDVWLTRYKRVCAVCKRRVIAPGETNIRFDSDSETEPDDRTPLINSENILQRGGGTFQTLRERLGFGRSHQSVHDDQVAGSSHSNVGVIHSVNSAPNEYDDSESVSTRSILSYGTDSCGTLTSNRNISRASIEDFHSANITGSELSTHSSEQEERNSNDVIV